MNKQKQAAVTADLAEMLIGYAQRYETEAFLTGDPSWFMHQVTGDANRETMAFLASCLSYGSRSQFMPKIQQLLDSAAGEPYEWVRSGSFRQLFAADDRRCFYRLYSCATMHHFLAAYEQMLVEHGTLGDYVRRNADNGLGAVQAICQYFGYLGVEINDEANHKRGEEVMISTPDSKVKVFVIPTNEELVIARDTRDIISG